MHAPVKMRHSVYLMESDGRIKIGHSKNPHKRHVHIKLANPNQVAIVHTWGLPNDHEGILFEQSLHRLFAWARVQGEWFSAELGEIWPVGDLLAAGRPTQAEALALTCQASAEAWKRYDRLSTRVEATRRRRGGNRNEELALWEPLAEEAWEIYRRLEATAKGLGKRDMLATAKAKMAAA